MSIRRFEWLLQQRGYTWCKEDRIYEVLCVTGKKPDFYVRTPHCSFLAELKSFREPSVLDRAIDLGQRVGVVDPGALQKRVNERVHEAARQLKPYSIYGIAMVVVLDNWRQVRLPLDARALIGLFGQLEFRGWYRPEEGKIEDLQLAHGGSRVLTDQVHRHVSAVLVNTGELRYPDDDMSEERPMWATILFNPFAAVPLPKEVFRSPADTHVWYEHGLGWVVKPAV